MTHFEVHGFLKFFPLVILHVPWLKYPISILPMNTKVGVIEGNFW